MKISRSLHETDLARTALLPSDEKRNRLRQIRDFAPRHSWQPFRSVLPGIYQARKSLLELPRVSWDDVSNAIRQKCRKHPNWLEANLELAELVFDHASEADLTSVEWSFGSLPVGFGAVVKFWPEFYSVEDDCPLIVYADPRRGHGLTKLARSFVFSAMYHHIARGDFDEARFKIAIFPVNADKKSRSVRIFDMSEAELVDLDTLNRAVQETYQIWFEILEERKKATRETPTGTGGLFT